MSIPGTHALPYAGFTDWLASWLPGGDPASYDPGKQAALDAQLLAQNQQILAAIQGYQERPVAAPVNWTKVVGTAAAVGGVIVIGGLVVRKIKNIRGGR